MQTSVQKYKVVSLTILKTGQQSQILKSLDLDSEDDEEIIILVVSTSDLLYISIHCSEVTEIRSKPVNTVRVCLVERQMTIKQWSR